MIGQTISIGIGSPASIPYFILFGLSPTGPVAIEVADGEIIYVMAQDRTIGIQSEDRTIAVPADTRTILAPVRPTL